METIKANSQGLPALVGKYIQKGKVVVCPTDTVYGLIADATSKKAVDRIFRIKGREKGKPLPLFISSLGEAKALARIGKDQEKFLKTIWPGRVTVVFKRKGGSKIYGVKKETIALRIPKHPLLNKIMAGKKVPLTATSANIASLPAGTKMKEVLKQFKGQKEKPDLIIDAGDLKPAKPSTIIDLTGNKPKILRK